MSILYVQQALRAAGFDPGAADGKWGPKTQAALAAALRMPVEAVGGFSIDPSALALIKDFEGFVPYAYKDAVGVWTIGYGTTARAGLGIDPQPGMIITEAEAEGYLLRGLEKFAASITPAITRPATPAQLGAMLSLAYNIGPSAFLKSSALRRFNEGDTAGAADAFRMWNKAGGKTLAGLTRRREAERALFLTGGPHG